ncbi:MAG: histidine phosphatase family protein [Clostridiales bacterium]|nr:histidine phosphatase family protein [Clostridiales bacterium]
MLLYLVRHGDPIYETDTLTERGKIQAESVGRRMQKIGIDQIYSSPMGRARETAAPACRLLNLPCQIEPWAEEISWATRTPYPDGQLKSISRLPVTTFRGEGRINLPYDKALECLAVRDTRMGEAQAFLEKNFNDFVERLGYKAENGVYRILRPSEEKVALFCHGAMTRALLSVLFHIPVHMMWASFDPTHTGVTVLDFQNYEDGFTAPRCLCFSDISHLYAEGLDTVHCNRLSI